MSKLFDAIERIRHQEAGRRGPSSARPETAAQQPSRRGIKAGLRQPKLVGAALILALLVGASGAYWHFAGNPFKNGETLAEVVGRLADKGPDAPGPTPKIPAALAPADEPAPVSTRDRRPPPQVRSAAPATPAGSGSPSTRPVQPVDPMAAFNARGVALVADNDHWQGIYYFEQARKANPQAVEPLINLGVALVEIGLLGPARDFFRQASELNPEHPVLLGNLQLLADYGLLEEFQGTDLKAVPN